jgi:hypothetical protein
MNPIDIIAEHINTTLNNGKTIKSKTINGKKERATKTYFKRAAALSPRKQGKINYDTFRREQQPDSEDLRLEDIHFANFLGISTCALGDIVPYNGQYYDEYNENLVNISECDKYVKQEQEQAEQEMIDHELRYQEMRQQELDRQQEEEQEQEHEQQKQEQEQVSTAGTCHCQGGKCVLDHTIICYRYAAGFCALGNNCFFAHGPADAVARYQEQYADTVSLIGSEDEGWVNAEEEEAMPMSEWEYAAQEADRIRCEEEDRSTYKLINEHDMLLNFDPPHQIWPSFQKK